MSKLKSGHELWDRARQTVADRDELEALANLGPLANSPFSHLRDALVAEIQEGDSTTAVDSSSSSSSSPPAAPPRETSASALLHQRATALRSVLMGCRLSHMEMLIGVQAHCKSNAKFYRQSTA